MGKRLILACVLCFLLAGCGSGNNSPDPGSDQKRFLPEELRDPVAPEGIDSELFDRLVSELQRVVLEEMRNGSATAQDEMSAVQLNWMDESSSLRFRHRMRGDYDNNGEVNISDITPIAQYFGQSGPFDEDSPQAVVDGDGNGEINIADVTPIGVNFGRLITGYQIFTSNDLDEFELPAIQLPAVQSLALSDGDETEAGLVIFNVEVFPDSPGHFFWVRPSDGEELGVASNIAGPGKPPEAVLSVRPWIGEPHGADFNGGSSTSPLGLLLSYEFDVDDDGVFDISGPDPTVSSPLPGLGNYVARMRVTDENGTMASVRRQYSIMEIQGGVGEMGMYGGEMMLGDVKLSARPGALLGDVNIMVEETSLPDGLPDSFTTGGPACRVELSDEDLLNAPLLLELPYDDSGFGDEETIGVLYFDEQSGWLPTTLIHRDVELNRIQVDTRRFGTFVVGWFDPSLIIGILQSSLPFDPELHGWNINNFGNYFAPGGNCLGMSGYCQWFYTEGPPQILNGKYSSAGGNPVSIAHLTSARSHLAQSQAWAFNYWDGQMASDEALVGLMMKIYLSVFEDPLILLLGVNGSGRHACVFYDYDDTGFTFYDVNSKDNEQFLPFDGNTGFGTYGSYNSFGFVGMASLGRAEDFNHLTTEAENGFILSQDIQLTSPGQGQVVSGGSVNVTGNLLSGLNGQSEVIAYVNGMLNTIPVDSGFFSGSVPISTGDNTIIIMAGTMSQSDFKRNGATVIRSVSGITSLNKVAFYNNWQLNDSDIDIYVLEPGGQAVWPGNKVSKNLLRMSMDNRTGYGPEVVSIQPDNDGQVLSGEYLVRVHYRGYNGDQSMPVVGRVTIVLNEGTQDVMQKVIPYVLQSPNPDNIAPDGEGPDWVDIASVDVENGVVTLLGPAAGMQ